MLGLNYAEVLERYLEESWQPANKAIRNGPELAQFVRNLMELQVGIFINPTGETGLQPNEFLEQLPRGTAYTVDLPGIKEEVRIGELTEDCTPEERYDHYLELSRASVLYELQRLEQRSPLSDDVTPAEHKNLYDWVGMVRQAVADGNLETPTVQRRIVLAGLTAFDIVGTISPETAVDNLHRRIDASIEVMESLPPTAFSPDLTPGMRDDQVQTMRFLRDISEKQRGWIERMLAK
ncbi:MAG: hypothetical protein ABS79_01175 [Planctomycetes bacterium SCN 63-9]|nr:MAG: hypothetical protein ABS79_01175 [Planctomycetes bacterium SCN 63-9]